MQTQQQTILQAEGLVTGYIDKNTRHRISKPVDIELTPGSFTCVLGANGTGKSTLLRTIAGLQKPLQGVLKLDGVPYGKIGRKNIAASFAVVLTDAVEAYNTTVRRLVALGRAPFTGFWGINTSEDETAVDKAMQMVGIGHLDRRNIRRLSDGEMQKALIAKALAQQTRIILLDEPTAFLDYKAKTDIMLVLRRLAHEQNKSVMMTTHDVELALQAADNILILESDGGIKSGTPAQLSADGTIARNFASDSLKYNPATMTFSITEPVQQ